MESKQAQDEDKIRTEILKKWTSRMSHKQGRRHDFSTGGQIPTGGGGQIRVNQNHLPPNSNFSSDFGHFILKILEDLKIFTNMNKSFFKNRNFWGDTPTEFRTGGGHVPGIPLGGDAHAHKTTHQAPHRCLDISS